MDYEGRAQFYYAYSSLVLYSFGLENALEVSRLYRPTGSHYIQLTLHRDRKWISRSSCLTSMKLRL